jgi:hypothetical protein
MTQVLIERLLQNETERKFLIKRLNEVRASRDFLCGCGQFHKIKECDALDKMYYVPPSGCTDGAYWKFSELQVICPVTDGKNRFLFPSFYKVEYEKRYMFKYSAEEQFIRMYGPLLKSRMEDYDKDKRKWWNNVFVDENHDLFDIDIINGPEVS